LGNSNRPPRPFRILAFSVLLVSIIALAFSWYVVPLQETLATPSALVAVILLALAAVLSENYALALPRYTISLAYPLTVAAIVIAGPTAAAIVAALTAVSIFDFKAKTAPSAMLFNLGELVLVTLAAGWTFWGLRYLMAGGPSAPLSLYSPWILVPLVAMALVCTLGNVAIMALGLTAMGTQSLRSSLAGLAWLVPSQLALAFVGYFIAMVLAINPIALPLFVAPLLVARQLYQRYAVLKEAYADTVRSLVGALEAKDPYTRGHSERVAGYALRLGEALGLESLALERLEYAALLHDLGKLAVPSQLLTKPGSLTAEEMDLIRLHPTRGAEMVAKIPPLRDLAEYVANHHEWYGGGGYPLEKREPMIPHLALILCVADSYDAMTTTRSYRAALSHEQAVAELEKGAGQQFDPGMVAAFISGGVGDPESPHEPSNEAPAAAAVAAHPGGRAC